MRGRSPYSIPPNANGRSVFSTERYCSGRCRTFVTMRTAKSGETGTRDRDLASARRPGRQQSHVEKDDRTDRCGLWITGEATLATAAPRLAFEAPHWRLPHFIWRLRRPIGDSRTSFGV